MMLIPSRYNFLGGSCQTSGVVFFVAKQLQRERESMNAIHHPDIVIIHQNASIHYKNNV